ncbi:MAG: cyclase family protein [Bdellovibrionales bacterium]
MPPKQATCIDLSHLFDETTPCWPGDEKPAFQQTASIETDGYVGYTVKTSLHVGTHIDAPRHMLADGAFLSDIPTDHFFGRGQLIDAREKEALTPDLLDTVSLEKGDIVLLMTGWDKHFGSPHYFEKFPEITDSFARRLVEAEVSILGLDTPSPDSAPYAIHKTLLSANILILENLCHLDKLIGINDFEVFALPAKIHTEGAPVRVIARRS